MNRRIFTILLEDVERTLFRSRPTANYEGGGRRCARIPLLLHVSRICIESRHNEADYRKIVHEYLESGQVGRGFHHRMSNESRNIVGTRTDFAMTREEREREGERIDWTEMLNDLRISKGNEKSADNKEDRIEIALSVIVRSFYDLLFGNGAIPSDCRLIFFCRSKIGAPL